MPCSLLSLAELVALDLYNTVRFLVSTIVNKAFYDISQSEKSCCNMINDYSHFCNQIQKEKDQNVLS